MPIFRHPASRYALALLVALAALYLRWLLVPLLGLSHGYHTAWLAVVFCAWFCGVGPSVLATLIMAFGVWFWFLPPRVVAVTDPDELLGMAGFLLFSAIIIAIGERARRIQAKLNAAHDEMESTVKQRTAELASANQKLHELSTSLLHTQDSARRRLARDLHDTVGQLLAAVIMNLSSLDEENLSPEGARVLADCKQYVAQVLEQVRTISHLLHPPLLDESGLGPALKHYLEGFSERSKITTNLQVPPGLPRFSQDLETAVFRIVQECLTNTLKHAAARSVTVVIQHTQGSVHVEVSDNGKGMPPGQRLGVGLTGMQERVRELHGTFHVESSPSGTTITAAFPALDRQTLTATAD